MILRGLLTPEIVPRLGVVLFKPGKELMSLFAQGRVLITPQPEYMAGFPTGKVPDARQPLSVDRSLVPFFTDPRVITAAGGIEGLERWLSLAVRQCQNHDEGYHHIETVILRQDPGSVLLCWHCDNKLRDEPDPAIKEIASRNVIDWVIDMVLLSLGCTRERTLSLAELCWWAVQSGISDAITETMAEKALRIAPEPHRSVYRDSDIIPAIPAADILKRRLDKRESHAITGDLETGDHDAGRPILRLGVDPDCPEAFMLRPKRRRWICPQYTQWVKTQECACCRQPADDPHHIIGHGMGGTATKAHDLFVIPLCRAHHDELHANLIAFEEKYGSQLELLIRFLDRALGIGVIFKE